jgi:hypothetical protein
MYHGHGAPMFSNFAMVAWMVIKFIPCNDTFDTLPMGDGCFPIVVSFLSLIELFFSNGLIRAYLRNLHLRLGNHFMVGISIAIEATRRSTTMGT